MDAGGGDDLPIKVIMIFCFILLFMQKHHAAK